VVPSSSLRSHTTPRFDALQLPWPAGQSPFRGRGLLYQGARDYYDQAVPGGSRAIEAALPTDMGAFFRQMFTPSLMFDVLPIVPISAVAARLAGKPHLELVRDNARWLAERDIRGIHKLLLGVLSPSTVATRLPRAAMRYFDFGQAEAKMVDATRCSARQRALPAFMVDWFGAAVDGFVTVALTKAGARAPRVTSNAVFEGATSDVRS
jgi:hypothetical protein